ncbi:hypothetical protein V8C86DRAFT_3035514 [Haematococcus lacustris]
MQPVYSPQTCNNLSIESRVVARAKPKLASAWSSWRLAKRKAIQAAFLPIDAPFRSQHVIWYTTAPSNSNCDHYCAHGPNIIAANCTLPHARLGASDGHHHQQQGVSKCRCCSQAPAKYAP